MNKDSKTIKAVLREEAADLKSKIIAVLGICFLVLFLGAVTYVEVEEGRLKEILSYGMAVHNVLFLIVYIRLRVRRHNVVKTLNFLYDA